MPIQASNYLDIKPLLDLTCGKIASMMKDKTTEEIRAEFDIVNDFTREEEMQVCTIFKKKKKIKKNNVQIIVLAFLFLITPF